MASIGFQRDVVVFLAAALPIFLVGCSTMSIGRTDSVETRARIIELEKQLKQKKSVIETLRERNQVLELRVKNESGQSAVGSAHVPVPFTPLAAYDRTQAKSPTSRPQVLPQKFLPEPKLSGDQHLYAKILHSYRSKKTNEMERAVELMLKTYRDSVFADNSLYLAGLLAIESENPERAKRYLDRLLVDYPTGNKAVAALFAKGIIEKKRGRFLPAKRHMERVIKDFPGSPEAARARLEIRIIDMQAGQRQES